jgi:hypothetical protein
MSEDLPPPYKTLNYQTIEPVVANDLMPNQSQQQSNGKTFHQLKY